MRQIGTLPSKDDARRFADYLLTQGVDVKAEPNSAGWAIWVRDENQLDRAREELGQFEQNPADERYRAAAQHAAGLRRQEQVRHEHVRRNMHNMGDRWNRPVMQRRPLTVALIALSVFVSFTSGFSSTGEVAGNLSFAQVRLDRQGRPVDTGYQAIERGQLWRLVTPIFIHFNLMHLFFNASAVFVLGGMIEERRGTWRLGLMALALAIISNMAEYEYSHNANFGGLSGVAFGLFGYLWMKTLFDPKAGFYLDTVTIAMVLVWFFLCFTPAVGNIANGAHVGGLLSGMAFGYVPILARRAKR
jgi:GlpG protein